MKHCKKCGEWKGFDAFYEVKKNGRTYRMRACSTCTNAKTIERKLGHRGRSRAKQAALRELEKRQRAAALSALGSSPRPLAKVPHNLQEKVEQVIARVRTGDSLEFACRRVDIPIEAVKAWTEAA